MGGREICPSPTNQTRDPPLQLTSQSSFLPTAMDGVTTENRNVKLRAEEELGGAGKLHFPSEVGSCGHTDKTPPGGFSPT